MSFSPSDLVMILRVSSSACCRSDLRLPGGGTLQLAQALDAKARRLFGRSLELRQVSAGGCNGCEADVNVLGTLVFDLGRIEYGSRATSPG